MAELSPDAQAVLAALREAQGRLADPGGSVADAQLLGTVDDLDAALAELLEAGAVRRAGYHAWRAV